MKAYVVMRDPLRRTVDLYFIEDSPGRLAQYVKTEGDTWTSVALDEGVEPGQPSLTIPHQWAEELVRALVGGGVTAPDEFVAKALERAEGRVDRMLDHLLKGAS